MNPNIRHLVMAMASLSLCSFAAAQQFNQQQQQQQDYQQGGNRRQQFQQQFPQQQQQQDQQQGFGRRGGGGRFQRQYSNFSNSGEFNNDYGILSNMNIFMRNRQPPPDPSQVREARPLTPEEMNVLTGVVQDVGGTGTFHASVENIMQSAIVALKVGDRIANGEITEITVNPESGVRYKRTGGTDSVWIPVGSNFTGAAINSMTDARASSVLNSSQFQAPQQQLRPAVPIVPLDPNTAGLSIEERLRARRMAEAQGVPLPAAIAPPPVEPQVQEAPPPPADPTSIEERLRLRRLQETGGAR